MVRGVLSSAFLADVVALPGAVNVDMAQPGLEANQATARRGSAIIDPSGRIVAQLPAKAGILWSDAVSWRAGAGTWEGGATSPMGAVRSRTRENSEWKLPALPLPGTADRMPRRQ